MGQYEPVFSKVDNPNKENLNINHQVLLLYMENLMKLEKETDKKNWYKNDAKRAGTAIVSNDYGKPE